MAECPSAQGARVNELNSSLDDVVLSRPRLSILAALISGDAVDFTFLQKNLGISDGNLSTHLSKLEAERYIHSNKTFVNKKPKTWYQITTEGRHALERLFRQLEGMLMQAKPAEGLDDGASAPNATSS
jgi:DNA-binding MarR family transcriptional regulator